MAQPHPPSGSHLSPRPTEPQPDSTTGLLSRLIDELSTLLQRLFTIAKAELSGSI